MPERIANSSNEVAAARTQSSASPLWVAAGMAVIAAATCIAYLPAMQGQFIWDDDFHVTAPALRSWEGLARIWTNLGTTEQYYPLLHTSFWVQWQLWGDHVTGYHVVNVLLHVIAACLVFLILRRLKIPGAWLAAAIFALHPVQVESVAWITEQKNTLSAVFYLSTMLSYLRFDETRRRGAYGLSVGLFVLALLSKTTTVTLPAALLVIIWWRRGSLSWRRDVLPVVPFFLLSATAGLVTTWVELKFVGAEGSSFHLTLVERTLLAGRNVWFYLSKLIWPTHLVFVYPRWQIDTSVWWQWLFPAAVVAVTIVFWCVRRRWRTPLAGWLFYVGTLFPLLGFFNAYLFIYTYVADHFQYLASLGMFALFSAGLALAIVRLSPSARWLGYGLCAALLATLGTLTWIQSEMYSDIVTLYRTTIDRNPTCWLAYNNLGALLFQAGHTNEAIEDYQEALRQNPDYALAHYNLGIASITEGRVQEGIDQYEQAIRLKPDFAEAYNRLGNALNDSGQRREAIANYEKALRLKPNYPDAHYNLGLTFVAGGLLQEGIEQYQQAVLENPNFFDAHLNLGIVLCQIGHPEQAIEHFDVALRLNPGSAATHTSLGLALAAMGLPQEAIAHYQEAIKLQPDFIQAYANLAKTLFQFQRSQEATLVAQKALELARAQGQRELAEKIEAMVNSFRSKPPSGSR